MTPLMTATFAHHNLPSKQCPLKTPVNTYVIVRGHVPFDESAEETLLTSFHIESNPVTL